MGKIEFYDGSNWVSESSSSTNYRTGLVTNIGDVDGPAVANLTVSGCITSAEKLSKSNEGNEIVINYNDAGYVPFVFAQILDTNSNGLASSAVRPGYTSTQATIFLRQDGGFGNPAQDVELFIMLAKPNIN